MGCRSCAPYLKKTPMNHLNAFENRLRGWRPRPPSPRLKARLFPADPSPPAGDRLLPGLLGHWSPVAIGLLMTGLLFCQRGPGGLDLGPGNPSRTLLAAAFSNQFYAAYLPDVDHSWQNHSTASRMRWASAGDASSSNRSYAQPGTNQIVTQP